MELDENKEEPKNEIINNEDKKKSEIKKEDKKINNKK